MDGYAEVAQKRALRRSMDDLPEADFWPTLVESQSLGITVAVGTTIVKMHSRTVNGLGLGESRCRLGLCSLPGLRFHRGC